MRERERESEVGRVVRLRMCERARQKEGERRAWLKMFKDLTATLLMERD